VSDFKFTDDEKLKAYAKFISQDKSPEEFFAQMETTLQKDTESPFSIKLVAKETPAVDNPEQALPSASDKA
jgi:hypothetical protein